MNLPADQTTEKAVERRRSAEAARKARIFNTRLRVMGIDTNALRKQVEDKKHSENMEMQRNKAFGKLTTPIKFQQFCDYSWEIWYKGIQCSPKKITFLTLNKEDWHLFCFYTILEKLTKQHNDLLLQQEINETNQRAALHTNLAQYWATHQRAEDSRDADLKYDLKGAVGITVPEGQLGLASMQIFQVFIKRLLGMHHTTGHASNRDYEQPPVDCVFVSFTGRYKHKGAKEEGTGENGEKFANTDWR